MVQNLEQVLAYHQATKHHLGRFARGPGHLDWANQPDPFRRYEGAPVLTLTRPMSAAHPPLEPLSMEGSEEPAPLNLDSVSQLFFDSLAISAWKQARRYRRCGEPWSLRVNPSSGNLHPTEGYLLCGPVAGLTDVPMIAHYRPRDHALEVRTELPLTTWQTLTSGLPSSTILVGLSSIHWREAWKYGERAFRYCQLDVGHAIAALAMAAVALRWHVTLLDGLSTAELGRFLGISDIQGAEAEHPDCLMAIVPRGQALPSYAVPERSSAGFAGLAWRGRPNPLSPRHVEWSAIDEVAAASSKPRTDGLYGKNRDVGLRLESESSGSHSLRLRQIIHQRRSAVAMDAHGRISRELFYQILARTLTKPGQLPLSICTWPPTIHLVLFVHRVDGLVPGLYLLIRNPGDTESLRSAMREDFEWEKPLGCPAGLALVRLLVGDAEAVARQLACHQAIASDGCFSLGMIARFEAPLHQYGPWFYRRMFWECGMIGQNLYLEAEAAGMRGTGIGCFFDDAVHHLLGLDNVAYQSLYHFTVGYPIEDEQLTTLPAYP